MKTLLGAINQIGELGKKTPFQLINMIQKLERQMDEQQSDFSRQLNAKNEKEQLLRKELSQLQKTLEDRNCLLVQLELGMEEKQEEYSVLLKRLSSQEETSKMELSSLEAQLEAKQNELTALQQQMDALQLETIAVKFRYESELENGKNLVEEQQAKMTMLKEGLEAELREMTCKSQIYKQELENYKNQALIQETIIQESECRIQEQQVEQEAVVTSLRRQVQNDEKEIARIKEVAKEQQGRIAELENANARLEQEGRKPNLPMEKRLEISYNQSWNWVDKIIFILKQVGKPLRSPEIIQELRKLDAELDKKADPQKSLSVHLSKALKYGRIVATRQKGIQGYLFSLPKPEQQAAA